jgi:hypothetical protein
MNMGLYFVRQGESKANEQNLFAALFFFVSVWLQERFHVRKFAQALENRLQKAEILVDFSPVLAHVLQRQNGSSCKRSGSFSALE